jgi:hypothetical protein
MHCGKSSRSTPLCTGWAQILQLDILDLFCWGSLESRATEDTHTHTHTHTHTQISFGNWLTWSWSWSPMGCCLKLKSQEPRLKAGNWEMWKLVSGLESEAWEPETLWSKGQEKGEGGIPAEELGVNLSFLRLSLPVILRLGVLNRLGDFTSVRVDFVQSADSNASVVEATSKTCAGLMLCQLSGYPPAQSSQCIN